MDHAEAVLADGVGAPPKARHSSLLTITIVGWLALLSVQAVFTFQSPGLMNLVITLALGALCFFFLWDVSMLHDLLNRGRVRFQLRLADSAYRSELAGLPNRNYLLAELRKEMPRARREGVPFTLILFAIEDLARLKSTHGDPTARALVEDLVDSLRRVTRESDFFAHMGGANFCVMLNECSSQLARNFLNRMPDTVVAVGPDGEIESQIAARVYEYDLEALYALDVIRDLEGRSPRRRWRRVVAPSWLLGRLAGQKPGHQGGTNAWLASTLDGPVAIPRAARPTGTETRLGRSHP